MGGVWWGKISPGGGMSDFLAGGWDSWFYDPVNNLFKQEDYYKPTRIGNAFSGNYI